MLLIGAGIGAGGIALVVTIGFTVFKAAQHFL